MPTFSASRLYGIFLGSPAVVVDSTVLLGVGPTGDATARRRLVHPDPSTFAPVVYFQNPDRSLNIDNEVLPAPITNALRTMGTTAVTRFENSESDVIISEVWEADSGKFSMPAFMFRQLYEYLLNPPAYSSTAQTYIEWSPQDKNAKTYAVEMLSLAVGGGGDPTSLFDVTEFHPIGQGAGGATDPLANLDDAFLNDGSGLIDRTITQRFRILFEVSP